MLTTASAEQITYTFQGTLSSQLSGATQTGRFKIGDAFTFIATIDKDATPISRGPYGNTFINNQSFTDFSFTLTGAGYSETITPATGVTSAKAGVVRTPTPFFGDPYDSYNAGFSLVGDRNIYAGTSWQNSNYYWRSTGITMKAPLGSLDMDGSGQWPLFPGSFDGIAWTNNSGAAPEISLSIQQGTGGYFTIGGAISSMSASAVPEPAHYGLAGAGAIALAAAIRRRRR